MYVTPTHLAELPGAKEIAEVASPEQTPVVAIALMDKTLRGEDRSAFLPADIAIADAALARVQTAIADADATIDGYLRLRSYTLPLAPVPPIVATWALAITRYTLHKHRLSVESNDPIVRDYNDARKFLGLVADGKFSLGAGDIVAPTGAGSPQHVAPARVFDADTLADYLG